jgi:hypothetical protein
MRPQDSGQWAMSSCADINIHLPIPQKSKNVFIIWATQEALSSMQLAKYSSFRLSATDSEKDSKHLKLSLFLSLDKKDYRRTRSSSKHFMLIDGRIPSSDILMYKVNYSTSHSQNVALFKKTVHGHCRSRPCSNQHIRFITAKSLSSKIQNHKGVIESWKLYPVTAVCIVKYIWL